MTEREASRAKFEAWYRDVFMDGMDDAGEWDEQRNCYVEFGVHMAWHAWQASRQQMAEEAALVCDRMVSTTSVSYETGSACAAAIRSLTTTGDKA